MHFEAERNRGKLLLNNAKNSEDNHSSEKSTQCFPLFSMLRALNVSTVDYFSLDVEGAELQVLKTIPFDEVDIKYLTVEFQHTTEGKNAMEDYMGKMGYKTITHIHYDYFFKKQY